MDTQSYRHAYGALYHMSHKAQLNLLLTVVTHRETYRCFVVSIKRSLTRGIFIGEKYAGMKSCEKWRTEFRIRSAGVSVP
jgi:hypothetical protein